MKKQFKISVPKPCHENWSKMTPKEKGRFCQSCSKTVVDFTKKSKEEIQQYLSENFGNSVCGHFRREQLDTVTLEIPESAFHQNLSFQRLFLLALLIVMGTTLFSCQNSNGKKQKIEDVILIDSISSISREADSLGIKECSKSTDTTNNYTNGNLPHIQRPTSLLLSTGIVVNESDLKTKQQIEEEKEKKRDYYVLGGAYYQNSKETPQRTFMNSDVNYTKPFHIDSIIEIEELEGEVEIEVLGGIESYEEEEEEEFDIVMGYIIEQHPKFPESDSLTGEKAREDFNERMRLFFDEHFQIPEENLGLRKDRYRIYAQFEIDTVGRIREIKIRAPHPTLTKEVERVLKKLPQFIPGEQRGKVVNTRYTLPVFVNLED